MKKQDFVDLYLLCFTEDSYKDAEALWNMVPENRIQTIYDNGIPCSMLVLLDGDLINCSKKYPLYYVYAACTHPSYRKQGRMGQLLSVSYKKALEDGRFGLFLNPASDELVDYYTHEGFNIFSGFKTEALLPSSKEVKLIRLSDQDSINCRQKLIEKNFHSFIKWNSQILSSSIRYASECGGGAYTDNKETPNIFIFAEPRGNELFVREALGGNVQNYIPWLAYSLSCSSAIVRYPGTLKDKCFGMMLSENVPFTGDAYMGIALD